MCHLVLWTAFDNEPVTLTDFNLTVERHPVEYDPEYIGVVDSLVAEAGLLPHLVGVTFGFSHTRVVHEFVEDVDAVEVHREFGLTAQDVVREQFGPAQFGLDFDALILGWIWYFILFLEVWFVCHQWWLA